MHTLTAIGDGEKVIEVRIKRNEKVVATGTDLDAMRQLVKLASDSEVRAACSEAPQ